MRLDPMGIEGMILDYAFLFTSTLGALLLFLYFYKTNRLDFDEAPKYQMFEDEGERKK